MFKVKYVPDDDQLIVIRHGSARRAVAKRQVRDVTALGELTVRVRGSRQTWRLFVIENEPRSEQYARYREVCRWFGIRY